MMEDHAVEEVPATRRRRRTFPDAFKREAVERAADWGADAVVDAVEDILPLLRRRLN